MNNDTQEAGLAQLRELTATLMTNLESKNHWCAPLARMAWEIAYDLADGKATALEKSEDVQC